MSDRSVRSGLLVALAGHLLLLALLSLAWGQRRPPAAAWPQPQPLEVSLVKEVAPEATAPPSPTPPAPSVAPEQGTPEEAPPPAPAQPQPQPKPAAVQPAPAPKPATIAKPAPAAPAKATPAKPVTAAAPRRSRLAGLAQELAAGAKADATASHARGHRLGDNLLAGLSADAPDRKASATAPAAKAGPYPTASIRQAIARQIQPCADRQVNPGPGANQIVTTLNLRLNPDGTLAATPHMVRQGGVDETNERYAQRVIDLGIAAFKGCTPLKLPAEYYQTASGGWSNINYQWTLR
ncbi:cell envelope biogenesis protein TolA [uncultured Sphingomonas sp.]|uniref:cell envelope biogenesis protein TolA n=1 Tax=uncultured Sphingomonas sp. TaxID=158754 RepID=UPI0035CC9974